ncbi:MAG: VWA domain-containing protein [Blastocatellales bacterium]
MRSKKFARKTFALLLVIVLTVAVFPSVYSQSGRKPQPPTPKGKYETQEPGNSGRGRNDTSEKSNAPLADNTPVTVGEDGTIKMDTAMVTIPVSVIDRDGKFVPFLKKRDFQIYEDGVEQNIEFLDSVETPFNVVLMIDTSNSTLFRHEDIQHAALEFVEELRPDDKVMVVTFDENFEMWCDFTSSRQEIRSAIYRTKRGGSTKLYDAVDLVVTDALSKVEGRKAIVLFSDGVDTSSRYSNARRSLEAIEESGALAYSIYYDTEGQYSNGTIINGQPGGLPPIMTPRWPQPRRPRSRWPFGQFITFQFPQQWPQGRIPRGGSRDEALRGRQYMQDLADRSGGRLYQADSLTNLSRAFSQIAEELRHQYAISYYPTNPARDGSYRQIKVRLNPNGNAGLIVRARDGYRAASDAQAESNDNNRRKRPELKRRQWAETN